MFPWCVYVCVILMALWITGSTTGDADTRGDTLTDHNLQPALVQSLI